MANKKIRYLEIFSLTIDKKNLKIIQTLKISQIYMILKRKDYNFGRLSL